MSNAAAPDARLNRRMLDLAARLATRAAGDVEPNPLVGCIIGRQGAGRVEIIGAGHHRRFGGAHAEVEALASCRRQGVDPKGATMWVTLEPCNHTGKTGPCAEAILEAGLARVVIATPDPHETSGGGAERLRAAGVAVEFSNASPNALRLSLPWRQRVETGKPWLIAKWAQTIDGRLATRTGDSKWISNERSRLDVHRLRARVDAILTGAGTVLADDPLLTARGVRRVRRVAHRVVIDSSLRTPVDSKLCHSASAAPLTILCTETNLASAEGAKRAKALKAVGASVVALPALNDRIDLRAALAWMSTELDASYVMTECGPGLLAALFDAQLVDETRIYVAPMMLGDTAGAAIAHDAGIASMKDLSRWALINTRRFGDDIRLTHMRPENAGA